MLHGLFLGLCNMVAIGVVPKTDQFRINVGTTGFRVFVFFEHNRTRAFTDDKTIAVAVKRSRRKLRRIILHAGRKQRIKYGRFRRVEFIGTASDHHILHSVLDGLVSVTDRKASARAGGICRNQAACRAKINADVYGTSLRHGTNVSRCRNL